MKSKEQQSREAATSGHRHTFFLSIFSFLLPSLLWAVGAVSQLPMNCNRLKVLKVNVWPTKRQRVLNWNSTRQKTKDLELSEHQKLDNQLGTSNKLSSLN